MKGPKEQGRRRIWVKMFQPRFWEGIATGAKRQTVRRTPRRPQDWPAAGDWLDCRGWSEKPYRSPQVRLRGRVVITVVARIRIEPGGVLLGENWLFPDIFARDDGFERFSELVETFDRMHGLPFSGILIQW